MKKVFLIKALDEAGKESLLGGAYSKKEYALEALEVLRKGAAANGERTLYYYSETFFVK